MMPRMLRRGRAAITPRSVLRVATTVFVLVTGAFTVAACKENPDATDACKADAKLSWQCRDCCHANGADGWSFFGDACVCRN